MVSSGGWHHAYPWDSDRDRCLVGDDLGFGEGFFTVLLRPQPCHWGEPERLAPVGAHPRTHWAANDGLR
jgi:hypothetical protein